MKITTKYMYTSGLPTSITGSSGTEAFNYNLFGTLDNFESSSSLTVGIVQALIRVTGTFLVCRTKLSKPLYLPPRAKTFEGPQ
jgi:hypothetical protein